MPTLSSNAQTDYQGRHHGPRLRRDDSASNPCSFLNQVFIAGSGQKSRETRSQLSLPHYIPHQCSAGRCNWFIVNWHGRGSSRSPNNRAIIGIIRTTWRSPP
jgi:hypothetical protein